MVKVGGGKGINRSEDSVERICFHFPSNPIFKYIYKMFQNAQCQSTAAIVYPVREIPIDIEKVTAGGGDSQAGHSADFPAVLLLFLLSLPPTPHLHVE